MADSRAAYSADDVRERTNIVEVIAPYVRLRKAGKRFAGLCPFHAEQAPSFTVDAEKGLWHCFGCGAGGNVFHFLMRAENLTFPEAARQLAQRLGVELKGWRESDRARGVREQLALINGEAAHFFRRQLQDSAHTHEYLRQRRITDELIARFDLGWAPAEWDQLYRHLRRQGYQDADIESSGLCAARPRGDGYYDRFRGRVMFPIRDTEERVIGFGGRILEGDEAKYINSPETALFRKGRTLYGFPLARRAMGERERAIVVEGYFDAIACHAAGFTETVATLGTALTQEHLEVLRRHTGRVYAAYDSDSAGMKAVLRSHELFERARLEVRVVCLPEGDDPDSFLAARGADALAQELEQALTVVDYRLALITGSCEPTADGRLDAIRQAAQVLGSMRDVEAMFEYARRFAERLGGDSDDVRWVQQALRYELRKRTGAVRGSAPRRIQVDAPAHVERKVLAAMLQTGTIGKWLAAELSPQHFGDDIHRRVFESLKSKLETRIAPDIEAMLAEEPREEVCALLSELALGYEGAAEAETELRQAVERMCEWRDARRCKELLAKADAGEVSTEELLELTELRRRRSRATARSTLGEGAAGQEHAC